MRRFVRTFFVKRHAQVTVLQDGDLRAFEVLRWRASERTVEKVASFPYPQDPPEAKESVKEIAVAEAKRLAALEVPPDALCPWCPGFVPDPSTAGETTRMCPSCLARESAALDGAESALKDPRR